MELGLVGQLEAITSFFHGFMKLSSVGGSSGLGTNNALQKRLCNTVSSHIVAAFTMIEGDSEKRVFLFVYSGVRRTRCLMPVVRAMKVIKVYCSEKKTVSIEVFFPSMDA